MRKRIILLIALLTVVLAFASCKNKTKYTVSVKLAEGEQLIGSITTEVGKKALIGDVINETSVQKEGHIFKGWSIDGSSLVDKQLVVTENILLIPLFEVNSYKIKYTIDGEVFSEELLKYGSKIEVKQVPEKTGYTFKGWDKELPNTMPANDIELIGTYEKNKYTITYIIEGQENITRTYYYGDTIETIENPKLEGLNFVKWSEIIPDTMPDHNIEVYAEFDKKSFNINYYIDGVLYKTDSYQYNDNIDALEMAEKSGYTFSGWDKELPTNMPAYDIDVYGTYNKNTYYINYYIDNVLYKTISYLYDNSIKVLEVTSKTGYTFSGWDKVLPTNMPAQDIDVYGTYNINTYQINYYIDNELYKTVNYKYNELINNLDVPEKSGYTFSGWDKELPTNMPAENLNFYGSYVIAAYQITYVYEEGNLPTHTLNTLEELSQVFWDEFYAWSGSTKSLEEFKTEHLTSWKTGNHGTSKLYLANGETKIDEGYFINASANNKKWVNFINVLDKMVNEINPSQHAWDSTYVGYLRLYTFFMQSATYWTTERTQKMVESIKIEDTLKKTYQKGDEFKFLELSIEDGRAVKTPGSKLFPYLQKNLDDIITVPDEDLIVAFLDMVENHKMIVENSGLLTVAALKQLDVKDKKIVSILSGGNMDVITMSSVVQQGLVQRSRIFTVSVLLPDKPGELVRVASIIAEANGNVIKLEHNQFVSINRKATVELRITIEAFGHEHKDEIVDKLEAAGLRPRIVKVNI